MLVDMQRKEYRVKQGAYNYYIDTVIGQLATLTFRWRNFPGRIDAVVTREDSIPAALALNSQPADS